MDRKEKSGIEIAARRTVERAGNLYIVPGLRGNQVHQVDLDSLPPGKCSCSENKRHGVTCEHIYAAQIVREREENARRAAERNQSNPSDKKVRKTYHQDWAVYNEAQMREKDRFQSLLSELCESILVAADEPKGRGRPRLNQRDMIFSAVFKVYTNLSGRRFTCDLEESQRRGHIGRVPHYNSIFNYMESPKLTPILQALIVRSARSLRSVEVDFAVDSSGFETSRDGRWFEHAHGEKKERREFIKCHLMCGVKTNIVVSVEISNSGDAVLLPGLVKTAAEAFSIEEVSADKGYLSHRNVNAIVQAGGAPFIMPKVNSRGGGSDAWGKMFHFFQLHEQEFLNHYHKRSNVESAFHMIKAKFGGSLFSKSDTALVNETLCKVLCHNLVVLNHEMIELGINPTDWTAPKPALVEPSVNDQHFQSGQPEAKVTSGPEGARQINPAPIMTLPRCVPVKKGRSLWHRLSTAGQQQLFQADQ